MSSKKALRMLSPKVLEYPVKIFEINVSENSEAKEGDILVRLSDRNGRSAAIAAPFDCRIGIVDVSAGETLESQSSLLELDRIEEVFAAEIVENEPDPAPESEPEPEPVAQKETPKPAQPDPWAAQQSDPGQPAADATKSKAKADADRIAAIQAKYSKPSRRAQKASTVPDVAPEPAQAPEPEPKPQSDAERIASLQAKYSKPRPNARKASAVPNVTPPQASDPAPVVEPAPVGEPEPITEPAPTPSEMQSSPIEESKSQYQSEADRIADLQAKYSGQSQGEEPTSHSASTSSEQSHNTASESMELEKRLPFLLLVLIAPPVVIFCILWLFGLLPTELINPPRRPSIFFLIQHPEMLIAAIVGAGVPGLLYVSIPAPQENKWSGKFRVANIIAGIIGFFATMAVTMTPPNDLLILFGMKDGIFLEHVKEKRRPAAPRLTSSQLSTPVSSQSAQSQSSPASNYISAETAARQFVNQYAWLNSPRITPTVYSSFPADQFPEFKGIQGLSEIGGHPKGATLIGTDRQLHSYVTIYDTKKKGITLTPQRIGRAKTGSIVLSPLSKDQTLIGYPYIEIGQKGYGIQDFQVVSTTRKPSRRGLGSAIKEPRKNHVLTSHSIQGLGARVRIKNYGESQVIDVFKGDKVSSISQDQIGFTNIRKVYLERQGSEDFSLSVVGGRQFALFRCNQKSGCGRIENTSTRFGPGKFATTPDGYKPMRGLIKPVHDVTTLSFHRFTSRFNPDVMIGNMLGNFVDVDQFGNKRQNSKKLSVKSVFLRQDNKIRYFPLQTNGKVKSELVDIETLPNGAGYAMIVRGEWQTNQEVSWVVLLNHNLEPRGIWSRANEYYSDIMATTSGQLIVVGSRAGLNGNPPRPVFASLPY